MATIGVLLWLRQHAPGCPHFVCYVGCVFRCGVVVVVVAVAVDAATAAAAAAGGGGGRGAGCGFVFVCVCVFSPSFMLS